MNYDLSIPFTYPNGVIQKFLEVQTVKKGTKNVFRVVISLIYIIWGIMSPVSAFKAIVALDVGAMISAAVGILMLLAGIFGLIGIKKNKQRAFGIIIFIFSLISLVFVFVNFNFGSIVRSAVTALLAWLFILCL